MYLCRTCGGELTEIAPSAFVCRVCELEARRSVEIIFEEMRLKNASPPESKELEHE